MAPDLPAMHNETHARRHAHVEPVLLKTHAHASNKGHAQPRGGKIGARLGERPNSTTVEGRLRIRKVGQRGEAVYVLSPLGPARRRFGPLNRFARFSFSQFPHHLPPYNIFLSYIKFFTPLLFTVIM